MKILVFGSNGNLGKEIVLESLKLGHEIIELNHADCDISIYNEVRDIIFKNKPNYVINAAAFNDVDDAEKNKLSAMLTNTIGPKNISLITSELGLKCIHFSTNFVFDGTVGHYYEFDETNPLSVYGKTKLEGEKNILLYNSKSFVIRTSWLYGKNGKNFVNFIIQRIEERKDTKVVLDQISSPTYANDLAKFTLTLLDSEEYGIYHFANKGRCSKYEFACEINRLFNSPIAIESSYTTDFDKTLIRPLEASLSTDCIESVFGYRNRHWKEALEEYIRLYYYLEV